MGAAIPTGFCQCGCGERTAIADKSSRIHRYVKGQPRRYIRGHAHRRAEPMAERFWRHVDRTGECWTWTAATDGTGYGQFRLPTRQVGAHRASWFLEHGEWPRLLVCHRCDNKRCVRPDHLFLGTYLDNVRDMHSKGRGDRKLTMADVLVIRSAANDRPTRQSLAARYEVTADHVRRIQDGRVWVNRGGAA